MKKIIAVMAVLVVLCGCSPASPRDAYYEAQENPVSVMEDNKADKDGNIRLVSDDIEKTRTEIYQITKDINGYIFYENYRTVNVDQHSAVIKLALYNDTFLDCFNRLRKLGILVSSEISASLESTVQNAASSDTTVAEAVTPSRSSSLVIHIDQNAQLGDYTKVVFSGLGNFFNVLIPYSLAGLIVITVFMLVLLVAYITYHGLIRRIYKIIERSFKK